MTIIAITILLTIIIALFHTMRLLLGLRKNAEYNSGRVAIGIVKTAGAALLLIILYLIGGVTPYDIIYSLINRQSLPTPPSDSSMQLKAFLASVAMFGYMICSIKLHKQMKPQNYNHKYLYRDIHYRRLITLSHSEPPKTEAKSETKIEPTIRDSVWRSDARRLVMLWNNSIKFEADEEEFWISRYKLWVGKNIHTKVDVYLHCIDKQPEVH